VEQNPKVESNKITILDLLPAEKFSPEFVMFLCATLKIDPR
jgi:hypothetical protein